MLAVILAVVCLAGCDGRSLNSKTIVDMLEISSGDSGIDIMVEYRIYQGKDSPVTYGVYSGSGDNLWQAIGNVEMENFVSLYLENCSYINLVGEDVSVFKRLIDEVGEISAIHPKTWVCGSYEKILTEEKGYSDAQYSGVANLFDKNSTGFGDRFYLKDVVISQNDHMLPTLLPLYKEDGAASVLAWQEGGFVEIPIEDFIYLPVGDVLVGSRKIYLPKTQEEVEIEKVYNIQWVGDDEGDISYVINLLPQYTITHPQTADPVEVEMELAEIFKNKTQLAMDQYLFLENIDLFGMEKTMNFFGRENVNIQELDILVEVGI